MFVNVTDIERKTATNLVAVIFQKFLWRVARRIGNITDSSVTPFQSGNARFAFFQDAIKIPMMDLPSYNAADYLVVYTISDGGMEFDGYTYAPEVFNRGKPKDAIKGLSRSTVEKGMVVTTTPLRTDWESFGESNVVVQTPLSI